jgi:hypothetical protein
MLGSVRRVVYTVPYARAITHSACGAPRARDMGGWNDGAAVPTHEGGVSEPLRGILLRWSAPSPTDSGVKIARLDTGTHIDEMAEKRISLIRCEAARTSATCPVADRDIRVHFRKLYVI